MKKFRIILLLFLILSVSNKCFSQENNNLNKKITLEESIKITLQNSLDLQISDQEIYKSEVRVNQAKTGGYPSVYASAYYSRVDPVQSIQIGDKTSELGTNNQGQGKVTFNYPLYDGSKTTNQVEQATMVNEATICDREVTRQNAIYKAIDSYYSVLRAYKLLDVANNSLSTTKEQYSISESYYEEGIVAKADVLSAKAQVANTELGVISAQSNVELTKSTLNDTMTIPLDREFVLVDDLVYAPFPVDIDYSTYLACNNRGEAKKIMFLIGAAEAQIAVARSDRKPTVNFNFDYIAYSSTFMNPSNSINATFSASMPIFDRGVTTCKIDEAEANLVMAKINLEQLKKAVALQVKQAYLRLHEAEEKVDKVKANLESARQNYDVARLRYQEGIAPFIEVSNAQLVLTKAELDNVEALYDYYLAKAGMIKTTGLLPEDGKLDVIKLIKTGEEGSSSEELKNTK
jgi:outer membrane protein TolC